jgi:hypothetical protein
LLQGKGERRAAFPAAGINPTIFCWILLARI